MTTKTTGAEIKAFYADPSFWPEGVWHDDEEIAVNGAGQDGNFDVTAVADAAVVTIAGGVVLDIPGCNNDDAPSFEAYFKRWRKQQSTAFLLVECPKDKLEAVIASIVAVGGKVAK